MLSFRGSSRPGDQNPTFLTYPALAGWFFTTSTIWKVTLTIVTLITKINHQRTQNTRDIVPSKFLMSVKENTIYLSPMQCPWIWANFGRWWGTEKPDVLSMGSQQVEHNWITKEQWDEMREEWMLDGQPKTITQFTLDTPNLSLSLNSFIKYLYAWLILSFAPLLILRLLTRRNICMLCFLLYH